jgi:hypothetical protein
MDRAKARELFLDVTTRLDGLRARYFLMYGTALGACRDGDFPPDEADIDLGFLAENFVPRAGKIAAEFIRAGYDMTCLAQPFTRCWAIKLRKDNIGIDLVSFIRWQDQVHGDDCRFNPSTMCDFCGVYPTPMLERFEKVSLFGRRFMVPSPVGAYLAAEYGPNWRTPSWEHAYHVAGGTTRVDGFMGSRAVPANILEHL